MASFRRSEVKAAYSLVLAAVSSLPCLGAVALAYRNYDPTLGQIVYGAEGRFVPVLAGCVLLAMALSAVGFALGWSSALHPRNDKAGRSWAGFFLGGFVLTVSFILMIAFYMIRLERPA